MGWATRLDAAAVKRTAAPCPSLLVLLGRIFLGRLPIHLNVCFDGVGCHDLFCCSRSLLVKRSLQGGIGCRGPRLELFNLSDALVREQLVPLGYVGWTTAYGLLITLSLLSLGALAFEGRDEPCGGVVRSAFGGVAAG